jgi:hypothetical protein
MGWMFPTPRYSHVPEIPYVTISTISAIDPTQPDSFEISADHGAHNLRIAPGPIVYWSPVHKDFEILGLIARDKTKIEEVSINGRPPQEISKAKMIKGYSIDLVVETINNNPHS